MLNPLRSVLALSLLCSCADDDDTPLPYDRDETVLIGGGLGPTVLATPDGDECLNLDDVCLQPQTECGDDGRADVIVDENGAVVDVICYPTASVTVAEFEGDIDSVGNNVVLAIDGDDDGVDVEGDVTIDGNNVTIYGEGPDVSVIGGNLNIDKNNSLVRGVRIKGDVVIDKNNPSLVDCVIEGELTIMGNNVSVALCEIWGGVTITGNNAVLVSNAIRDTEFLSGQNLICNDNRSFTDADEDGDLAEGELGGDIDCGNRGQATSTTGG